jgi:hypothetical protein
MQLAALEALEHHRHPGSATVSPSPGVKLAR